MLFKVRYNLKCQPKGVIVYEGLYQKLLSDDFF